MHTEAELFAIAADLGLTAECAAEMVAEHLIRYGANVVHVLRHLGNAVSVMSHMTNNVIRVAK